MDIAAPDQPSYLQFDLSATMSAVVYRLMNAYKQELKRMLQQTSLTHFISKKYNAESVAQYYNAHYAS